MGMKEPNPPENPRSANEHAHAFAAKVETVDGVNYARVKRGAFTRSTYVAVSISQGLDKQAVAKRATQHGAGKIETSSTLKRATFTFYQSDFQN